jgi:hypothetical protein
LEIRRHEVAVRSVERQKAAAETSHETNLAKVQLDQRLGEAEAEKAARLAKIKAEREAELRLLQEERAAQVRMVETKADAERLALEQIRQIERAAEQTQAEAKRLKQEELAAAERAKEISLVEADAAAQSLRIEVDAEANAELVKAEAESNATQKRAQAAKIRAEATRAESAAPGLAEAEVEGARIQVAEKKVAVSRAEGLAAAEIARAQAEAEAERLQKLKDVEINAQQRQKDVEIKAQQRLVDLYDRAPVLVDFERLRMQYEHEERLTQMKLETSLKAVQAIAPGVRVRIFGNGGQNGSLIGDLLSFTQGLDVAGEDIPIIARFLSGSDGKVDSNGSKPGLSRFLPYIQQVFSDVNPRVFSSLKVSDLVDRLEPVVAGDEDLASALDGLREDASFRVVGDLPVGPILSLLGFNIPKKGGSIDDTGMMVDLEPDGMDEKSK